MKVEFGIGQAHQNTTGHGIVFLLTSLFFVKYRLSRFTRKFPFYPHIRVKWDFDPGNMGCIFSCVIRKCDVVLHIQNSCFK